MNIGGLVGALLPLFFVLALGFLGPAQPSSRLLSAKYSHESIQRDS